MYWIKELEKMRNHRSSQDGALIPLYVWDIDSGVEKKQKNDQNRAKDGINVVIIDMNGE